MFVAVPLDCHTCPVAVSTETEPVAASARRRSPVRRVLILILGLAMLTLVALPAYAASRVIASSGDEDSTPTDVIVVLGAAQFWGKPSPVLQARLARARELYRDGLAPRIVTVGGNQPGDLTTEAQVGKSWLVAAGVRASDVSVVPTGHDTLASLTAVAQLMAARGWDSATIVSDPAHLARSLAMAEALGMDAHGAATTSGSGSSLTVDYVARETAGLLYFWVIEHRKVDPLVGV